MARRNFQFNKLIRNTILTDMQESGDKVVYRILSDTDYVTELKRKLIEESLELSATPNGEVLAELADLQEIINCLLVALQSSRAELSEAQERKRSKKGSFDQRIYVESVEVSDDEPWIEHYLENPERYPEL